MRPLSLAWHARSTTREPAPLETTPTWFRSMRQSNAMSEPPSLAPSPCVVFSLRSHPCSRILEPAFETHIPYWFHAILHPSAPAVAPSRTPSPIRALLLMSHRSICTCEPAPLDTIPTWLRCTRHRRPRTHAPAPTPAPYVPLSVRSESWSRIEELMSVASTPKWRLRVTRELVTSALPPCAAATPTKPQSLSCVCSQRTRPLRSTQIPMPASEDTVQCCSRSFPSVTQMHRCLRLVTAGGCVVKTNEIPCTQTEAARLTTSKSGRPVRLESTTEPSDASAVGRISTRLSSITSASCSISCTPGSKLMRTTVAQRAWPQVSASFNVLKCFVGPTVSSHRRIS
mmetsp:Transcript_40150/g.94388  ORF Transcript_40150/g.94388 Transcript_40150/m.94388 type:complete len:342 (+) Transcript_40150:404-1429(+)